MSTRSRTIHRISALSFVAALALAPISGAVANTLESRDDLNFEGFIKGNPQYLLMMKDKASYCEIEMRTSNKSEKSRCNTLYTLVQPNGLHEFDFMRPDYVITLIAPPGGRIQRDGTHWAINHVSLLPRNKLGRAISWSTPGECVINDGHTAHCSVYDGKVSIKIDMTSATHRNLK